MARRLDCAWHRRFDRRLPSRLAVRGAPAGGYGPPTRPCWSGDFTTWSNSRAVLLASPGVAHLQLLAADALYSDDLSGAGRRESSSGIAPGATRSRPDHSS